MSRLSQVKYLATLAAGVYAFRLVNQIVQEPYLDEIFHVPQTRQYCAGDWKTWDPKITTPPGLYVLGVAYAKLLSLFQRSEVSCTLKQLRHLNFTGVNVVLPTLVFMLTQDLNTSVAIVSFPLVAFYSTLYYTDVWSTAMVLMALVVGSRSRSIVGTVLSGVIALASIAFRQTNVIWAAFTAVVLVQKQIPRSRLGGVSFLEETKRFVLHLLYSPAVVIPYVVVGGVFLGLVRYNGGIALGDKDNHAVNVNIPQIFYCTLFWMFFSWPLWLDWHHVQRYLVSNFSSVARVVRYVVLCAAIAYVIKELTIVHAFMLADNRHYVFYLWRRLIHPPAPYRNLKYIMVPFYHAGMWSFLKSINYQAVGRITPIALIGATALAIIPSPLLEPRYYVMTYVLWRTLLVGPRSQGRLALEWVWYMAINAFTLYMFLYRPFKWQSEPENWQRFMW
ncbi:dol-P-Glc:Glc(2)Man(9)GlcNAc(2)-PP-Dol alpha-1,2-glucosyltransferase [Trichomonascus vanleenenianus]|uniref:dolichyl-P-Glc:Glc(2)Man(9)GlcNAc(2)-PP-dolichol alpha-1,2- glucosyltransferase n=1 Tax=Trichomonascus vanleenenianus TaxID=2268995 RepID=UPI003ECA17C0